MEYDIIVIGSATRDAFFEGIPFAGVKNSKLFKTGSGICLSLGSKVLVPKIIFTTGGAGTNAAATFARMGYKTAAIARVGRDVSGEEVRRGLEKEGVDCSMLQIDKKYNTAYSVVFLAESGERTILTFKGCGKNLSETEIRWDKMRAKWFYIDSLQGNEKLLKMLINCAKKNKIHLAANPGAGELKIFKKNPELLSAFDIFVLNQEEASFLTGIPYQKEKEIFKKLDKLVDGIVCMTKGQKGSATSDGKFLWQAGCYKEKRIIDRTGAGDAFASGFVAGFIKRLAFSVERLGAEKKSLNANRYTLNPEIIEFAIKLGSANATSVVEYIGAKEGILTSSGFKLRRWNKMVIKKIKLKQKINH